MPNYRSHHSRSGWIGFVLVMKNHAITRHLLDTRSGQHELPYMKAYSAL